MNMISQLRKTISENGQATITVDEFNQLQAEWITRAQIQVSEECPVYALQFKSGRPITHQDAYEKEFIDPTGRYNPANAVDANALRDEHGEPLSREAKVALAERMIEAWGNLKTEWL